MNANAQRDAIDSTIDRALSALRDARPRSGSEMLAGRILAHLEHRTATVPGGPSFRIAKGWGIVCGSKRENLGWTAHLALWTATAAAILAVASMLILHHHAMPSTTNGTLATAPRPTNAVILSGARSAESKDPDIAKRATNSGSFSTTNLAQTTHTVSSRPDLIGRHPERSAIALSLRTPVSKNCSDHLDTGCPIHDGGVAVGMGGVSTTPTDAQLLADLHAPSHPAPPFTLSPQEKLVLHMLRYGNLTQLAELSPEVRAKHDADETAAFKAFFPDPPPLNQPLGDTE